MAFVHCATCKNEYDNYDSKCPYCDTPAPALANLKPMVLRAAFVIGLIAVGAMMFGQNLPIEKWIPDLTSFTSRDRNTPTQTVPRTQPPTAPGRAADTASTRAEDSAQPAVRESLQNMSPSAPVANAQLLTSVAAVDLYSASVAQMNSSIRLSAAPVESPKNTFTYTLSDKTKLVLVLDSHNRKIQSVTVNDSDARTFAKRVGDARAAFFAAALPPNMQDEDINAQFDYLQQLVDAARNNEASYRFQGYQLFARLENNKRSISIKLTL